MTIRHTNKKKLAKKRKNTRFLRGSLGTTVVKKTSFSLQKYQDPFLRFFFYEKKHRADLKSYHEKIVDDYTKVSVKYSKKVSDSKNQGFNGQPCLKIFEMRVTRDNLAKQRRFREAHDLDISIRKRETLEKAKFEEKVAKEIDAKLKHYRTRLGKEMKVFETKRERVRSLIVTNRQDEMDE